MTITLCQKNCNFVIMRTANRIASSCRYNEQCRYASFLFIFPVGKLGKLAAIILPSLLHGEIPADMLRKIIHHIVKRFIHEFTVVATPFTAFLIEFRIGFAAYISIIVQRHTAHLTHQMSWWAEQCVYWNAEGLWYQLQGLRVGNGFTGLTYLRI